MLEAITQLLASMGISLPPWGMPVAVLAVLLVLSPAIYRNLNTGKARKLLKRASVHEGVVRQDLEAEAIAVVSSNSAGLVAIAEEALRRGRKPVAEAAVARLFELEPDSKEARRLRREMAPKLPPSEVEMELVIERLLEAGMVELAGIAWTALAGGGPDTRGGAELEARLGELASTTGATDEVELAALETRDAAGGQRLEAPSGTVDAVEGAAGAE